MHMLGNFASPVHNRPLVTPSHGLKPGMGSLVCLREFDKGSGRLSHHTFEPPVYPESQDGRHPKGPNPHTSTALLKTVSTSQRFSFEIRLMFGQEKLVYSATKVD